MIGIVCVLFNPANSEGAVCQMLELFYSCISYEKQNLECHFSLRYDFGHLFRHSDSPIYQIIYKETKMIRTDWMSSQHIKADKCGNKLECDLSSVKIWTMHNVDGKEEVINSRCKP